MAAVLEFRKRGISCVPENCDLADSMAASASFQLFDSQ